MSGMMIMMTGNVQRVIPSGGGGGAYATGGTVYDISGYKVHIFNSSDTFATTASWPSGRTIEYLVVAGGGGGNDGGGGGGGVLSSNGVTAATSTNYAVTIGGGGGTGTNGANTSLIGGALSVTAIGGGAAGDNADDADGKNGGSGGSGVVILSIPISSYSGITTGSPTVTTSGSNKILTYTSSGSYTA
jgi:hypothetical protein